MQELAFIESAPKQDGRNMVMVLGPTKKTAEARAADRRRREAEKAAKAVPEPQAETPVSSEAPEAEQVAAEEAAK